MIIKIREKIQNLSFDSFFLSSWRPFFWVALTIFLVYGYSLSFGYVDYDDNVLLLENFFFVRRLGNVIEAFRQDIFYFLHLSATYYRPLLMVSFIFDAQLAGKAPFYYHFVNLLLHLMSSCLLYLFLNKLSYSKRLSFFFSLIFAVHPAIAQAVAWIPGRNDSLLAVFFLSAFIFFLDWVKTEKTDKIFLHLLFFGLAMFTKESSIALPLLCLGYLYFFKKRLSIKKLWPFFLGWLMILLAWFILRDIAFRSSGGSFPVILKWETTVGSLPAVFTYIGKSILPFRLSVIPTLEDSTLAFGFVSLGLMALLIICSARRNIYRILFGFSWFFILLLPSVISLFGSTFQHFFLEHRLYLPIIGLFIVFLDTSLVKKINSARGVGLAVFFVIPILFSAITLQHLGKFKNALSFWQSAIASSPHSATAYKALGAVLNNDYGEREEAKKYYQKALELNPKEPYLHNNLGAVYLAQGLFKEAENEFLQEIEVGSYDGVLHNLGVVYLSEGRLKEGEEMLHKALNMNHDFVLSLAALASYYYDQGDYQRAIFFLEEAKKRDYSNLQLEEKIAKPIKKPEEVEFGGEETIKAP